MRLPTLALIAVGLAAVPAWAQTTTTPPASKPATPPATTTTPPAATTTPPATTTPGTTAGAQQRWYTAQADDMRASKLIGTTVRNAAGESVGDVNEVIIDKTGRVEAVVVGVGGFLGIGEREVAMSFNALQPRVDSSGTMTVTTNLTREDLRGAPAFTWSK